jgi:hypothetical protein
MFADGVDGRRLVAALEKECPRRGDDGAAGEPGARLVPASERTALDCGSHDCDTNTLELRVILSY